MQKKIFAFLGLILLTALAYGCGASGISESISLTLTPMSGLIRETLTARAGEEGSSDNDLATAVAKATAKAEGIHATQTARAALNEPLVSPPLQPWRLSWPSFPAMESTQAKAMSPGCINL